MVRPLAVGSAVGSLIGSVAVTALLSACTTSTPAPATTPHAASRGHVVVVVMENHSFSDVIGAAQAPYLNQLAGSGASLTAMYAIAHPSQPNYLALFSGSTQSVSDDVCPQTLSSPNLAQQLIAAGLSFAAYSEGLPNVAALTCSAGRYARKHAPWTNFANVPGTTSIPFSGFPTDFTKLPSLSFVVPDLSNDMHDGSVSRGDAWVHANLARYATWAVTHGSQLVITWDEDDRSADNHIPTIIIGAGVATQALTTHVTLYSLLRYLEDRFGLAHLGNAATATPITLRG